MAPRLHLGMGLLFYPRGGSAQVVRYLARALEMAGWETTLATGSLGRPGDLGHAATFFDRDDVVAADFTEAQAWFDRGDDPLAAPMPFHPSYEERSDVPDRVFAAVSPDLGRHQVASWSARLGDSRWPASDVLHLHHLTPLQAVVRERWPDRPVVTQLHGTELKFLVEARRAAAEARPGWEHGPWWSDLMIGAARRSDAIVCISEHDRDLAVEELGVDADRIAVTPNGVDIGVFDRRPRSVGERLSDWANWLVDDPRGWDESGVEGSVAYDPGDLDAFVGPDGEPAAVLLFVGRFLGFKRVPMLIRAYARARSRFDRRAPLVVWGGSPGEWEGEHPVTVAREVGDDDIFFVGWRGHDELPVGLAASSVMVAPSTDEPFGQVFLEAMASGVPVVATRSGGPLSFVNTVPSEPNGWLVPPDDEGALTEALVEAVNDPAGRERRADHAYRQIRGTYSWGAIAERYGSVYLHARER